MKATLYTAEDLAGMEDLEDYELDCGILEAVIPTTPPQGRLCARLAAKVGPFVEQHDLGHVYDNDLRFLLARNPDVVRGPDVAVVSNARVQTYPKPGEGYWLGAPDLAIEVLSPGKVLKRGEVLAGGDVLPGFEWELNDIFRP